ncbi:MAG: 2-oxoacid:ferredoxin oxidoreductase subunit beta [Candidatus Aenigmarchaeota archaeon]|nr:2-oxoacid:ferredoxin oxidoreductase subunit beta [Candidatus Aenigmarchaeota archaeon]
MTVTKTDQKKVTLADLTTKEYPSWCQGCGDHTILFTLKNALVELDIDPHNVVIVTGIGCGSKVNHFIRAYGFEGLHGRALPVASGIKLANKDLTVIVVGGDGDGYGIGGNHFIQSMRRNLDITYLVQNNAVYGLTKGQYSPTSSKGFKSSSTPDGALEEPINPLATAIVSGATYVARGYSMETKHLQKLIVDAVRHKGFSLVDILQICTTYNKVNTWDFFKQRLYKLEGSNYDATSRRGALQKAEEWGDKIPIGLLYKDEHKPSYEDKYADSIVGHDISNVDITPFLNRFR